MRPPEDAPGELCLRAPAEISAPHSHHTQGLRHQQANCAPQNKGSFSCLGSPFPSPAGLMEIHIKGVFYTPAHNWGSTLPCFCSIRNVPLGMILAKKGHDTMQNEEWGGRAGSIIPLFRWTCEQCNLPQRLICQAKQTLPSAAERPVDLWALRGSCPSTHNLQKWMSYKSMFPELF